MPQIWDVDLDVDGAAVLRHATVTFERHRWEREPLPLPDVPRLLEQLRTIAVEDERNWRFEAGDRLEGSRAGSGSPASATTSAITALELADGSREALDAIRAAADDLAARLEERA